MKKVGFVYDDVFLLHDMPPGHPESKDRLIAINNTLQQSPHWKAMRHLKPRKADDEDILAVHTASYVSEILHFTGYFDPDTYVSPRSVEAALFAAGAVTSAVDECKAGEIERAVCAVRPPGHHAEADRAMGFCIFNHWSPGER